MRIRPLVFLSALIIGLAAPLFAQDTSEEDKSFLESWLEDALSDAGRDVVVSGFQGALSSNATLDTLTIADDEGVWFTMRGASLQWSRAALFSRRLEVAELTAAEIIIARMPKTEEGVQPQDAEATKFSLPELPISIDIDLVRAAKITLGSDILGEPAVLSLEGGVSLANGAGAATLDIQRTDRDDRLNFEGSFSNETRVLKIDFDFTEASGGLVSSILRIPDRPALQLQVNGEAPLSDFSARVTLASDGQRRFGGGIGISALPDTGLAGYAFSTDLTGDVRPLFARDLQPFFGEAAALKLKGQTLADGRLILDQLQISSEALALDGRLTLAATGWPETLQLRGRIGGAEAGEVRLPLAGPATTLRQAEISASFDAALDDLWQAEALVTGFARDGLRAERARLSGSGRITPAPDQSVNAVITFATDGIGHVDPALARALGTTPSGTASIAWEADEPLVLSALTLRSDDVTLTATGELDSLAEGFPVTGRATLQSADLTRFAPLAGRDIAGRAKATIEGSGSLLGGSFDIALDANTTDLQFGEPRIDPLLQGQGTLSLVAQRDTEGTRLERLAIRTPGLTSDASGRLDADDGQLSLKAAISEINLIEPRLSGPADLDAALRWQSGDSVEFSRLEASAADATLSATGAIWPEDPTLPAEGQATLVFDNLSRFSKLAGRPLAGQLNLSVQGNGQIQGGSFDLSTRLSGQNLRTGLTELDRLIAGSLTAEGALAVGDEIPDLRFFNLTTPRLRATAEGAGSAAPIAVSTRLSDLGLFVPGFGGPATAEGSITLRDRQAKLVTLALNVTGPGGVTSRVSGDMRDYGNSFSLAANGRAPLGLANRFISPRSLQGQADFDLRLDGPPALASLSGLVKIGNGRLSLPRFNSALSALNGTLRLASGRAEADITGTAGTGGSFRLRGPITLATPYDAELETTLASLGISDPNLYRTTVSGAVSVTGPLTGGASISGVLNLGRTELRVPSGGPGASGPLADIRHINEPAAVNDTRRRSGLIGQADRSIAAFPLDLTINAPNRIFVRGRGLDAELGGQLRLRGTTADVSASGLFELIRGRLDILGRRLNLTEGLIDLRGALDPYLRFVAETESEDIVVRVIIEGLASAPSVSFVSTPELPQEEAVARLLFGRGLDKISPFQAAQLVSAAATLSGQRSGGLTGGLRNAFDLSDFDVTTTDEGATQLRAGAYLSDNLYSEVTADSDGNQKIDLKLDLSRSVTIKGSTDTTGNTGIGIFFEKDY